MPDKLLIDVSGKEPVASIVPLTPEEEAQRSVDELKASEDLIEESTRRQLVLDRLGGLAGISYAELTSQQLNSLLIGMLYKSGILDNDLKVLPLEEWL